MALQTLKHNLLNKYNVIRFKKKIGEQKIKKSH